MTDCDDKLESNPFLAIGNAVAEGQQPGNGNWFIGHFISDSSGLKSTRDVEIKWGIHASNEEKAAKCFNEGSTTLTILISGLFVLIFPELDTSVTLRRAGDYVISAPKVVHGWKSLKDSVVITVRWPSLPDDQKQRRIAE